jgi:hypothetical protein
MRYNLIVIIMMFKLNQFGQINWSSKPIQKETNDSIYLYLKTKLYYNYFYQKYDSVIVNFETGNASEIVQTVTIGKSSKDGFLNITFEGRLLFSYLIKNNSINGIGLHYNSLMKTANGIIFEQGLFKAGKLNGFYIYSDWTTGQSKAVIEYKNSKIKKVLYAEDYKKKYWKSTHSFPGLNQK